MKNYIVPAIEIVNFKVNAAIATLNDIISAPDIGEDIPWDPELED